MPRFLKARSKFLTIGGVLVRDQGGQALDDGDVDAEGLPDGGELDADHAAAEDDRALGDVVHGEGFVGGDDLAADFQAGERAASRSRWPGRCSCPCRRCR